MTDTSNSNSVANTVTAPALLQEFNLNKWTLMDYRQLNVKNTTASMPYAICFNKKPYGTELFLYPLPNQPGNIRMTIGRSINDVTQASDTLDLPVEWQETLMYNLATR